MHTLLNKQLKSGERIHEYCFVITQYTSFLTDDQTIIIPQINRSLGKGHLLDLNESYLVKTITRISDMYITTDTNEYSR